MSDHFPPPQGPPIDTVTLPGWQPYDWQPPTCGDCHYYGALRNSLTGTCYALPQLESRAETNRACVLFTRKEEPWTD